MEILVTDLTPKNVSSFSKKQLSNIRKIATSLFITKGIITSSGGNFWHIRFLLADNTIIEFHNDRDGISMSKKTFKSIPKDQVHFRYMGWFPNVEVKITFQTKEDFSNPTAIVNAIKFRDLLHC